MKFEHEGSTSWFLRLLEKSSFPIPLRFSLLFGIFASFSNVYLCLPYKTRMSRFPILLKQFFKMSMILNQGVSSRLQISDGSCYSCYIFPSKLVLRYWCKIKITT